MRRHVDILFVASFVAAMITACTSNQQNEPSGSAGKTGQSAGSGSGGVAPGSGGTAGASSGGANNGAAAGDTTSGGGAPASAGSGPTPNGGAAGLGGSAGGSAGEGGTDAEPSPRSRTLITSDWRFAKGDPQGATGLGYTAAKAWVLPTGNRFVKDPQKRAQRPVGNLGDGLSYVQAAFDDSSWRRVDLPHDYAIEGPFTDSISSSMGRLPSIGVTWYRKALSVPASAEGKSMFLDIDGAMSYSMVWVNGRFAGGWPYGYASFRIDLTPYIRPGAENLIAIRLDNPTPPNASWDSGSSRWYPGAGIYRNVWLVQTEPVHVGQWGTRVTTPEVSAASATVNLDVSVDNDTDREVTVSIATDLYEIDAVGARQGQSVASLPPVDLVVAARNSATAATTGKIASPKLWGTPPQQRPNRYVAVTKVSEGGRVVDVYETRFGVRTIEFDANRGFSLNGQRMKMQGVCMHHDLGALGAAVNTRAVERQLEILAEMGSNAVRTAHNPPSPEVLEAADRMGFLIMDEAFDVWAEGKAALDHHLFFNDWHEQDLRALIRRDRNHPSVVMWSIGNELVEQSNNTSGPAIAKRLNDITREEDPTRPTVAGMNSARPENPFSGPIDTIGLNYQGTGVRGGPPQYPAYHTAVPNKFIIGTETVSTFSSRGVYTFPVAAGKGVKATGSPGIANGHISSYDLYFADWSYSPDSEFESQERYDYVGGEFVWTGFDYLGEPTPLDSVARSSYFGIVDLAGFKKDRFYLYQARWRPEFPMAHILPHWTWAERAGQVTPVHVYTSGDEAELFLNGTSLGRKAKGPYEYRLRWDDVVYQPGELSVVAYKGGAEWATAKVETAGAAAKLALAADRAVIAADGRDLSFVTLTVQDAEGRTVPRANSPVRFEISGPGEIVATDNGDPTDRVVFSSKERSAFSGKALAIVRALPGQAGELTLTASSQGLTTGTVVVTAR